MKDKLLTLGGFDRAKAWIDAALQAIQTRIAGILPSMTGNSGKLLKTNGTDASWATLNSAIPVLTSPVRIWDLEPGIYLLPDNCTIYYDGESSTSSQTVHASQLTVVSNGTYKRWECWSNDGTGTGSLTKRYSGYTSQSSGSRNSYSYSTRASSNYSIVDLGIAQSNGLSDINTISALSNGYLRGYMSSSCTKIPSSITLSDSTYYVIKTCNASGGQGYFSEDSNCIRQDLYLPTLNKHFYRIVKYYNSIVTPDTSITNADPNGWVEVIETLPTLSGNAGKVLAVNNSETGVVWVPQSGGGGGGGLSDYDFTHTANSTISTSTATITFAANTRGSAMLTISADLGLTIACNNEADNYLWIKNTGSAEVDVTISGVTANGTTVSNVYVPSDGITVPAGGLCEIGVIVNADGAFITSRNDLAL